MNVRPLLGALAFGLAAAVPAFSPVAVAAGECIVDIPRQLVLPFEQPVCNFQCRAGETLGVFGRGDPTWTVIARCGGAQVACTVTQGPNGSCLERGGVVDFDQLGTCFVRGDLIGIRDSVHCDSALR